MMERTTRQQVGDVAPVESRTIRARSVRRVPARMVALDAALVIQPQETLSRHLSPEDASEALAAATAA